MKIEFIYREPGNHHVIRTEEGDQQIPRAGDLSHIDRSGYTVREVLWIRNEKTVRLYLD